MLGSWMTAESVERSESSDNGVGSGSRMWPPLPACPSRRSRMWSVAR